jgi:hypothetical protein
MNLHTRVFAAAATVLAALSVIPVAACGPGAAEIRRARDASYHGDPAVLFDGAVAAAAAELYKIDDADRDAGAFVTHEKFYTAEGMTESAGNNDAVMISDRTIGLVYTIRIVTDDAGGYHVSITPQVHRLFVDRPNADDVPDGDPTYPGWVRARTDALAVAIHDQLAAYEAK